MGYNLSKNSVIRVKLDLELLRKIKKTIKFPTPRPDQKARALNQALAASEVHEEFKHFYDEVKPFYRFKLRPGYLIAEYIGEISNGDPIIVEEPEDADLGEEENLRKELGVKAPEEKRLIEETAFSLIEILGTILANLDAQEISFPNASLDSNEKMKIYGWTKQSENISWNLIDSGDKGIVLTKDQVPFEIIFQPPPEETDPFA